MKVYLCGMIGSGKTTIGRPLAAAMQLPFFDLDDEMDRILGHSFHDLVREKGWLAFRELEYSICKSFAAKADGIFGLGGGTVRYEWNMDVLRDTGLVVLLTAPPEVLVERVRPADRPRVHGSASLEEDIRLLWSEHREKYMEAAPIHYRTDRKPVEDAVAELKRIVLKWAKDPKKIKSEKGPLNFG